MGFPGTATLSAPWWKFELHSPMAWALGPGTCREDSNPGLKGKEIVSEPSGAAHSSVCPWCVAWLPWLPRTVAGCAVGWGGVLMIGCVERRGPGSVGVRPSEGAQSDAAAPPAGAWRRSPTLPPSENSGAVTLE